MTGPSLAGLWDRKAGSLPSFERYSDALKSSGIIWEDRSLDAWLADPDGMVPDNEMPFNGIKDPQHRADLLAFLKDATKPGAAPQMSAQGQMGGMGGMMGGGRVPNLKSLEFEHAGEDDHLLSRHLSGDHGRWQDPRLLGAQSAPENRFWKRRSAKRRASPCASGNDG